MNIIIVGGGTAGWLAALFISKVKPEHKVTIVESSKIGIVGAGEGSTGLLLDILNNNFWDFGCDLKTFFKECNATLKYGIKHENWTQEGNFYYGPIDGSSTYDGIPDGIFSLGLETHYPHLHHLTQYGLMIEHNISPLNKIDKKLSINNFALHFDAHLVGQYFKKLATQSQVKNIDAVITNVNLDEQGYISNLLLDNNETIYGDFFIDASGFSKKLINTVGGKWHSYSKYLPVNSAIPFLLNYNKEIKPTPYTTARALSSGWMWKIPTQTRLGCGYVYCDSFISDDQALDEIEKDLNTTIEPIKVLKFDTGRQENVWIKNCMSLGLSAAFTEPLEATSIHSTILQLLNFVWEHLLPTKIMTCNDANIKSYNLKTNKMFDDFKDFLVAHYLGGRIDSKFWMHISSGNTNTDFTKMICDMCKVKIPTRNDLPAYFGAAGWGLWSYVLAGTGQIKPFKDLNHINYYILQDAAAKIEKLQYDIEVLKMLNYSYEEFNHHLNLGP